MLDLAAGVCPDAPQEQVDSVARSERSRNRFDRVSLRNGIDQRAFAGVREFPAGFNLPPPGHFESFVRANGDTIRKVIPEVG